MRKDRFTAAARVLFIGGAAAVLSACTTAQSAHPTFGTVAKDAADTGFQVLGLVLGGWL